MQESYFVICFNLDHRRYAIDQARIMPPSFSLPLKQITAILKIVIAVYILHINLCKLILNLK